MSAAGTTSHFGNVSVASSDLVCRFPSSPTREARPHVHHWKVKRYGHEMTVEGSSDLNLKQVAATLGVHYMTAFRYVRTGRLHAQLVGTGWIIDRADLERFVSRDDADADCV